VYDLKIIDEGTYKKIHAQRSEETERVKTLRILFNLRPGVFNPEDREQNDFYLSKIKLSIVPFTLGFVATSYSRFWHLKNGVHAVNRQIFVIFASYIPSMIYYNHWNRKYNRFLKEVSEKYKEDLPKEKLNNFVKNNMRE
jgi:hypothetical protein